MAGKSSGGHYRSAKTGRYVTTKHGNSEPEHDGQGDQEEVACKRKDPGHGKCPGSFRVPT